VTFVVRDEIVSENQGAWRVEVEGGRATVTKTTGHGVALDVRALATLYSGFRTAEALAWDGLATGSARDLAAATALFAGSTPALVDFF
jgi:predicted acetyltransferase